MVWFQYRPVRVVREMDVALRVNEKQRPQSYFRNWQGLPPIRIQSPIQKLWDLTAASLRQAQRLDRWPPLACHVSQVAEHWSLMGRRARRMYSKSPGFRQRRQDQ